jgi:HEAT repeat protein
MRSPNTTPLLTDLRVQAVQESREDREEKTEQYSVLEGLRKYAANHVLLVGRPGSGKSTALARLLLEESNQLITSDDSEKSKSLTQSLGKVASLLRFSAQRQKREFGSSAPLLSKGKIGSIPILVELRNYDKSILDLIDRFLKAHQLKLDRNILNNLNSICPLLLFDGINELPTDKARQDLLRFRQQYPQISMIFTTRSIELGGNLEIEKKLEMLPLTEPQMIHFVRGYLPKKGDAMLKNLGDRLKEFGQTPLLLWMLCSVFQNNNQIPANLGLVFRFFIKKYDNELKKNVPTYNEDSRDWWQDILQVLAWKMTEGKSKTDIKVSISRREAENILSQFLQGKVEYPDNFAKQWLKDLLKYHLLQLDSNEKIAFCHQLIQEYYAAEALFEKLSILSDEELQWNYLNYLKWNEPVTLMLGVLEDETQAIRVVRLGLEVDIRLGATLAGKVAIKFQKQTVGLISRLDVPKRIKVALFGFTESEDAVDEILQALDDSDKNVYCKAIEVLRYIPSKKAIPKLIKILKNCEQDNFEIIVDTLGIIGTEEAIPGLLYALEYSEETEVRRDATEALGKIGSDKAVQGLLKVLNDADTAVCRNAAEALGNIRSELAIPALVKILEEPKSEGLWQAAEALAKIGSKDAINGLFSILQKFDCDISIRLCAEDALIEIGSKTVVIELIRILNDFDFNKSDQVVSRVVADALARIGSETAIQGLLEALEHPSPDIRMSVVDSLWNMKAETAIPFLLKALEDSNDDVRWNAEQILENMEQTEKEQIAWTKAVSERLMWLLKYHPKSGIRVTAAASLGAIKSEVAIPKLLKALSDPNQGVRRSVIFALGTIKSEVAIPELLKTLNDHSQDIRRSVILALCRIGSPKTLSVLLKILKSLKSSDGNDKYVRSEVILALGNIGSETAISVLTQTLKNSDSFVRYSSVLALTNTGINSTRILPILITALEDPSEEICWQVTEAVFKISPEAAIPGLIKTALEHSHEHTRFRAVRQLGEIGSEMVIPGLIKAIQSPDRYVRLSSSCSLCEIGSEIAIPGLLDALENPDEDIRGSVVSALGSIKSEKVIFALLQALKDPAKEVRASAAESLGRIGSEEVIPELIKVLNDAEIRRDVVFALGRIGSEEVIPELIKALEDCDESVCWRVIWGLGNINSEKAILGLLKALENSNPDVRKEAVKALQKINTEAMNQALLILLKHSDDKVRFDAAVILAKSGSEDCIPELLKALQNRNRVNNKIAADALSQLGTESAIVGLIKLLKNPSWNTRYESTKALNNIISETNLITLQNALKNHDFATANEGDTGIQAYTAITMVQNKLKYYQPKPQTMNQKVYISYNWQEDSNEIANQIVQAFEAKGIEVIRDKSHTGYKDSIKKFMQEIGQGQCVIAVISDRYLKSPNCMFELVEIAKVGDFGKRIIPIVLKDTKIYKTIERLNYIHYWEQQIKELENAMKSGGLSDLQGITDDLNLYTEIRNCIASLTDTLKDMNTLTLDLHRQSEFAEMIQAVEAKLAEDVQNNSVSPSHNPISSPQSITYDLRGANIGNLAHNVQGNQHTNQPEKP